MRKKTINVPQSLITPNGYVFKQERGRTTFVALVEAGFRLLEKNDLDNISIAELTREAGYSVGAFYTRFETKDDFFDALIAYHLDRRSGALNRIYETLPVEKLTPMLVKNIVDYYLKHRRFWRTAQIRNARDPVFARTFRKNFDRRSQQFIDFLEANLHRKLRKAEKANIIFAFQIVLGTVNNASFNESGPILMGQKLFVKEMQRAFNMVSGIDALIEEVKTRERSAGKAGTTRRAKPRARAATRAGRKA